MPVMKEQFVLDRYALEYFVRDMTLNSGDDKQRFATAFADRFLRKKISRKLQQHVSEVTVRHFGHSMGFLRKSPDKFVENIRNVEFSVFDVTWDIFEIKDMYEQDLWDLGDLKC